MSDAENLYPFEIVIEGTPVSLQASAQSKERWKNTVAQAGRERRQDVYEIGLLDHRVVAVTIYYFPDAPMEGDIDNIVKLIVDGLRAVAYLDDKVIERVAIQKFEPEVEWEFLEPTDQLAGALDRKPPVVYVCVNDDLSWRRL
jgi:crossover junction endodeoxyribonuclease RusA